MNNKFTEDDKQKVIEFLNIVGSKASFNLNTQEVIKFYGLLSYMQKSLIPKIESNYLEIIEVTNKENKWYFL